MARFIYAGIDEAGYGPMFGPLVIGRCVFDLANYDGDPDDPQTTPPPLWQLLRSAVCRRPADKHRRIAVDDSKKIYAPSAGMGHLERGVLAFASLAGHDPVHLDDLLLRLGHDDTSRLPDLLWYGPGDPTPLPVEWTAAELAVARSMLRRTAAAAGVTLPDLGAAVCYEDRFNELCAAMRSKAACSWSFITHHLNFIWDRFGEHHPWVVVDRQGGRKVYHPLLAKIFGGATIQLRDESDDVSRYTVRRGDRSMTVSFEVGSEMTHMPAALASMIAKYTRELLMHRFNAFWLAHDPKLRPTAGYYTDGRRFLADIQPLIESLNIPSEKLIRSC